MIVILVLPLTNTMINFATILFLIYYYLNIVYSDCTYTDGSNTLNLTCLSDATLDIYIEPYDWIYTPCENGITCINNGNQINGMTVQSDNETEICFQIAVYDSSGKAAYNTANKTWSLAYANGINLHFICFLFLYICTSFYI